VPFVIVFFFCDCECTFLLTLRKNNNNLVCAVFRKIHLHQTPVMMKGFVQCTVHQKSTFSHSLSNETFMHFYLKNRLKVKIDSTNSFSFKSEIFYKANQNYSNFSKKLSLFHEKA
jgi:hypothetical protein